MAFRLRGLVLGGAILSAAGCAQILGLTDDRVVSNGDVDASGGDGSINPGTDSAPETDGAVSDTSIVDTGPPLTMCDGGLVDLKSDPNNCNACGNVCAGDAGDPGLHFGAICTAGVCGVGCKSGWAHCSDAGLESTGCDFDVSGDKNNCGACGHKCDTTNTSSVTCSAQKCNLVCQAGAANCNNDDSDGCEIVTANDPHNCGACGFDCGTATCVQGACKLTNDQETIETSGKCTGIAVVGNYVYWISDHIIRRVNKFTNAPANVWDKGQHGMPVDGVWPCLAVDVDNIYFAGSSTSGSLLIGSNSGAQDVGSPMPMGGNIRGIVTDGTDSVKATKVFVRSDPNSAGVYMYDLKTPANNGMIWNAPDLSNGLMFGGSTIYFHTYGQYNPPGKLFHAPLANPKMTSLGVDISVAGQSGQASTADGIAAYVSTGGLIYRFPGGMNPTLIVNGTYGNSTPDLATDGQNIYWASSTSVFKESANPATTKINATAYRSFSLVSPPEQFRNVAVDADAIYVTADKNVYRIKK